MSTPNLEIQKILNLPTDMLSITSQEALITQTIPDYNKYIGLSVYEKTGCGWFVYLCDGWKDHQEDMPEDLYKTCLLAEKYECEILCFDKDIPPVLIN